MGDRAHRVRDRAGRRGRAGASGLLSAHGAGRHSNGVHYDGEEQRRPPFRSLIADGTLPAGYATDDGVGLLYRGTRLAEVVSEVDGKAAYHVARGADGTAVETRLYTRQLS